MNVVLQNLNRDTDYRIGVAAVTTRGTGVPSPMSNIEAKGLSATIIDHTLQLSVTLCS